jgi:hypothetical protein
VPRLRLGPVCRSAARRCWLVPGGPVARVRCRRPARSGGACRAAPCWPAPWRSAVRPGTGGLPVAGPRRRRRLVFGRAGGARPNQRGDGHHAVPLETAGAPRPRSGAAIWNSGGTTTAFGGGHLEQRGHHDGVRHRPFGTAGAPRPSGHCGWPWVGRCHPSSGGGPATAQHVCTQPLAWANRSLTGERDQPSGRGLSRAAGPRARRTPGVGYYVSRHAALRTRH